MSTFLYFAYGSNTGEARIKKRCNSAKKISYASLNKYLLKFNKKSTDGSYKANLKYTNNELNMVYGVIYEISNEQQRELDVAEGYRLSQTGEVNSSHKKYVPQKIEVLNIDSDLNVEVLTYIAQGEETAPNPTIYDWYLYHIISGAEASNLPAEYIAKLKEIKTTEDTNVERKNREMGIYEYKNIGVLSVE